MLYYHKTVPEGLESVKQRAANFAAATRKLFRICEGGQLKTGNSIASLTPFGARRLCGLMSRPILLNPEAVFKELATQVTTFYKEFQAGADTKCQWVWPPRYVAIPPPIWKSNPNRTPYDQKEGIKVRVRKKTSSENVKHAQQAAWKRKIEQATEDGNDSEHVNQNEAPETNGCPPKRVRIRAKTSAFNTYYSCFTRSKVTFSRTEGAVPPLGGRAR